MHLGETGHIFFSIHVVEKEPLVVKADFVLVSQKDIQDILTILERIKTFYKAEKPVEVIKQILTKDETN